MSMGTPLWIAAPPELHSALLSSGPGPGPVLAGAAAWHSLSAEYAAIAQELRAVLAAVEAGAWQGPSAESYVAAHWPYLTWLTQASADSAAMAGHHEICAFAYTTALAAMPTLAELAANHTAHAVLAGTNFFGINTIAIALNEADYVRMWIQAATVMSGYHTVATTTQAAIPQTTAAPPIRKTGVPPAAAAKSVPLPPNKENQWMQWLQRIGYVDFYNNVLQPLIMTSASNPFFQGLFSGFDPWLPILGNPLTFLSPYNIAFALGYPMDIGSYVAFLSETFAYIGIDLAAAFATGNPMTIGFTVLFVTVEAIGTIITDTIALLKTLLEQALVLIPVVLPLLTVPLAVGTAAAVSAAAGLAGLAGLVGVAPPGLLGIPPLPALAPTIPPPTPAPASAPATSTAPAPTPGAPPPPATAGPPVIGAGLQDSAYLAAVLDSTAKRAASSTARKKAPESQAVPALAAPATPHHTAPRASEHGAGTIGFAGTAHNANPAQPAGLIRLPLDAFRNSPRAPMLPATWERTPA